jgi:phosphate/sulfate permease
VNRRSRRSRIIARVALFAAATVISTALAAPGLALAIAPVHAAAAILGHAAQVAENPALPPLRAGHRPPRAPRSERLLASVPQLDPGSSAVALAVTALLAAGLALALGLGGWLLEFVGRSSRTRGQPRMGVLAL